MDDSLNDSKRQRQRCLKGPENGDTPCGTVYVQRGDNGENMDLLKKHEGKSLWGRRRDDH